jgi:hypothetical protein
MWTVVKSGFEDRREVRAGGSIILRVRMALGISQEKVIDAVERNVTVSEISLSIVPMRYCSKISSTSCF